MEPSIILYYILAAIHILICIFVVFAFLNIETAKFNLTYLIPIIYIFQTFPVHLIVEAKCALNPNCDKDTTNIETSIGFTQIKNFFNFSFRNPVSAQGLLILGAILSYYKTAGII